MNRKLLSLMAIFPVVFLLGCTQISDTQELRAKVYCNSQFGSCTLAGKNCTSEGLLECNKPEFRFTIPNITDTNSTASTTIVCFEKECLHR